MQEMILRRGVSCLNYNYALPGVDINRSSFQLTITKQTTATTHTSNHIECISYISKYVETIIASIFPYDDQLH